MREIKLQKPISSISGIVNQILTNSRGAQDAKHVLTRASWGPTRFCRLDGGETKYMLHFHILAVGRALRDFKNVKISHMGTLERVRYLYGICPKYIRCSYTLIYRFAWWGIFV